MDAPGNERRPPPARRRGAGRVDRPAPPGTSRDGSRRPVGPPGALCEAVRELCEISLGQPTGRGPDGRSPRRPAEPPLRQANRAASWGHGRSVSPARLLGRRGRPRRSGRARAPEAPEWPSEPHGDPMEPWSPKTADGGLPRLLARGRRIGIWLHSRRDWVTSTPSRSGRIRSMIAASGGRTAALSRASAAEAAVATSKPASCSTTRSARTTCGSSSQTRTRRPRGAGTRLMPGSARRAV